MRSRWKTAALVLVLGAALGAVGAWVLLKAGAPSLPVPPAFGPAVGAAPADFTLETPDGERVSLERFVGKKAVLLAFWATWCPFCAEAIPALNALHRGPLADRVQVLAVDYKESREKVAAFAAAKGIAYPVVLDSDGRVARAYGVAGIPTYILIGREGRIAYAGNTLPASLKRYLDRPAAAAR